MKKWIMLVALAATMGASGYYGYTTLEKDISYSDLELANAEALANSEVGEKCGGCSSDYDGKYCCTIVFSDLGFEIRLYYPGSLFG